MHIIVYDNLRWQRVDPEDGDLNDKCKNIIKIMYKLAHLNLTEK